MISIETIAQKEEGTLPVELVYFRAFAVADTIWLQWGTATETNNYGFSVQRSNIGKQFEELGFVPGNVNSFSPKHYEFWDTTIPKKDQYFYRLQQIDIDGKTEYSDTIMVDLLSSVNNEKEEIPTEFILYQNYPNPFNPVTTISYVIPDLDPVRQETMRENNNNFEAATNSSFQSFDPLVILTVYDLLGRKIATLVNEVQKPGLYNYKFSTLHSQLPSGIIFCRLKAGNHISVRKMVLIK